MAVLAEAMSDRRLLSRRDRTASWTLGSGTALPLRLFSPGPAAMQRSQRFQEAAGQPVSTSSSA